MYTAMPKYCFIILDTTPAKPTEFIRLSMLPNLFSFLIHACNYGDAWTTLSIHIDYSRSYLYEEYVSHLLK